jgi:hypothetical protein
LGGRRVGVRTIARTVGYLAAAMHDAIQTLKVRKVTPRVRPQEQEIGGVVRGDPTERIARAESGR